MFPTHQPTLAFILAQPTKKSKHTTISISLSASSSPSAPKNRVPLSSSYSPAYPTNEETDDGSVNECLRAYDNPTFHSNVDPLWLLSNAETEIPRDIQVFSKPIGDEDKFLIFASSGLWKYLTSEEAVQIVHQNPRRGSAKGLAIKAMQKAAEKSGRSYDEMKRNPDEDIMVVVIFLGNGPMISHVGSECTLAYGENRMPSQFGLWEEGSSSDVSKERGSTSGVSNEKGSTSGMSKGKGSTSGVSTEKGSNSTSS